MMKNSALSLALLFALLPGLVSAQSTSTSVQLTPLLPGQAYARPVTDGTQDVVRGEASVVQKVDNDAGTAGCATRGASECLRPFQGTYSVIPYPTATMTAPSLGGLSWSTTYATSAEIACGGPSGGVYDQTVALSGSTTLPGWTGFTPGNYVCTLIALNSLGRQASSTATFTIPPLPTVAISSPATDEVSFTTTGAVSASLACSQGGTTVYAAATGASANDFILPGSSAWGPGAVSCTETALNAIGVSANAATSFVIAGPTDALVSPLSGQMSWSSANASSATLKCVDTTNGATNYNGGVALNSAAWAIPGAAGTAGTYSCTLKAIGAGGATAVATASTIVVAAPPLPPPPAGPGAAAIASAAGSYLTMGCPDVIAGAWDAATQSAPATVHWHGTPTGVLPFQLKVSFAWNGVAWAGSAVTTVGTTNITRATACS